jgi:hypothetical protein
MGESTGNGGTGRFERVFMRIAIAVGVAGLGWLQTGQLSLEGGEQSRDVDTVAILKVVHRVELRLQRLEDRFHPELSPLALPDPEPLPEETIDIGEALRTIRARVSKDEVETYQQAR